MARAAAKGKKGSRKAAGPAGRRVAPASGPPRRPDYEQQLFFGRIRNQAKWVFAFLAVVFAISFAFLGVGSGSGALNDLFTFNWFGGGPGDPVEKQLKKLEKDPQNPALLRDLGTTLDSRTPPRIDDAVLAYERWVQLRPRSVDALNALAIEYGKQAQQLDTELQSPPVGALAPLSLWTLAPQSSALEKALLAGTPDLFQSQSIQTATTGALESRRRQVYEKRLKTFQRLAKIQPEDPGWSFQIADTTRLAGFRRLAIKRYQEFIKRFPEDGSVSIAKDYIKQLQTGRATTSSTPSTTPTLPSSLPTTPSSTG